MIEGAISWAQVVTVVTVLTPVGAVLAYLLHAFTKMRDKIDLDNKEQDADVKVETDKLHERQSRLRTDLQGFRIEVAEQYVSNKHLAALEDRLTKSIDGLKDEIHNLVKIALQGNAKD